MKLIPLSNSRSCKNRGKYFAIVDDEDFLLISQTKWSASVKPDGHVCPIGYQYLPNGKRKRILMHRIIMNEHDSNILIDHKNRNPLDNQKNPTGQ